MDESDTSYQESSIETVSQEQVVSRMCGELRVSLYKELSYLYTEEVEPFLQYKPKGNEWMNMDRAKRFKKRCQREALRIASIVSGDDTDVMRSLQAGFKPIIDDDGISEVEQIVSLFSSEDIARKIIGNHTADEIEQSFQNLFIDDKGVWILVGQSLGIEKVKDSIELYLLPVFVGSNLSLGRIVRADVQTLAGMLQNDPRLSKVKWVRITSWIADKQRGFLKDFEIIPATQDLTETRSSIFSKRIPLHNSPGNPYPVAFGKMSKEDFIKKFLKETESEHVE